MKNCLAVALIRQYYSLPKTDQRSSLRRLYHRFTRFEYLTRDDFLALLKSDGLACHLVKNRFAWSNDELGLSQDFKHK